MTASRVMWVLKQASIYPTAVDKGVKLFQFKISLADTEPEVWRRIQVPGDFLICQFGRAVIRSVGWIPTHFFLFTGPDGELFHDPSQKWDFSWASWMKSKEEESKSKKEGYEGIRETRASKAKQKDAMTVKVSELFTMEKKTSWIDMGAESWLHFIELEKIIDPEPRKHYPKCIGGGNACPPEDCGGSEGYENLLKAIKDKKHPEHEFLKEWLVDMDYNRFDPKKFKVTDVKFYDLYN